MGRQTLVKNYNNLSGGVITDLNKLAGAPENAVKDALNFEFTASDGANRRKALDLESGISGSDYVQLNSDLTLGEAKHQVFTFKGVLDSFGTPTHDIIFSTFEGKGIVYDMGSDQQLADAVADSSIGRGVLDTASIEFSSIAWSPKLGMFAAATNIVDDAGDYVDQPIVAISADGNHWEEVRTLDNIWSTYSGVPSTHLSHIEWIDDLELFLVKFWSDDDGDGIWESGVSFISYNGLDWLQTYRGWGGNSRNMCWSSELAKAFVIYSNTVEYSSDMYVWADQAIAAKPFKDIDWSGKNGLLAVVADNSSSAGNLIYTSPDGITWTARTTPATDRDWTSIAWSPSIGKFVCVGNTDYIMHSSDGITWTESSQLTNQNWSKVYWANELGLFVAVATEGTNRIAYSSNGTTWTEVANNSGEWQDISWSDELGLLVIVADTGSSRTMTSTDAITWTDPVSTINDNVQDWVSLQGIPVGTIGLPELSILYNIDDTTFKTITTLGRGVEATIRDFSGLNDGLAVTDNPPVMVFNVGSIVGAFSLEDIEITGGGITRRFSIIELPTVATLNVDKSIAITSTTEFDGADTEDYDTWTVLGLTSGTTATINTHSGTGLSDAHRYNLINQGWTQAHMDSYATYSDTWPSNAQTWYSGRDSSNNFSPAELDKIAFGNSQAPKGHVLLNPFKEWRHARVGGVWKGAINNVTYSRGFTTLAAFGSRLALSGASIGGVENSVYISPVLINKIVTSSDSTGVSDLDLSDVFTFYQSNDPTADIGNALLPNDGLVVPVTGANRIHKLIELQNAVLVFADNGVWAISGLDAQSGFQTDSFSVVRVTGAPGTSAPRSVVSTSQSVYYWAADGIYAIQYSPEGVFSAANITINRIGGLYKGISPAVREAAISYYDDYNQKLYWAYNGETVATYPEIRNKMLVLDLAINAYYPLKMPQTLVDAGAQLSTLHMSVNGFTQDPTYPNDDGTIPLKIFVTEVDSATATNFKHAVMELNNSGTVFSDYDLWRTDVHADTSGTVDEEAYLQTWDDTLGDTSRSKQAIWAFTHMGKTEYGFEDLGGGALGPLGVSSLTMQNKWDWNVTDSGGKWGTAREIYRHKRPYVPVDVSDTFDTGESVITTKNKIYGRGRALSLRFDAQANKDAILLGYSIPYSVENTP